MHVAGGVSLACDDLRTKVGQQYSKLTSPIVVILMVIQFIVTSFPELLLHIALSSDKTLGQSIDRSSALSRNESKLRFVVPLHHS